MRSLKLVVVLCCTFVTFGLCDLTTDKTPSEECPKELDGLVVTWAPPNVQRPMAFSHLPRTTKDAEAQNWELLDNGCETSSLKHRGSRYILKDDPTVLILYDGRGHVAGLQATVPKDIADDGGVVDFEKTPYLYYENIKGKDRYVMTFHFINPNDVCHGRTELQFREDGTMNQLYIQQGPNSYLKPPLSQNVRELSEQDWDKGRCVDTMGLHYFNHYPIDMSCPDIKPWFLLYQCNELIGVGVFLPGNFTGNPRYEYVAKANLPGSLEIVPDCLYEMYGEKPGGITSMHVFFNNDPSTIICPK